MEAGQVLHVSKPKRGKIKANVLDISSFTTASGHDGGI